MVFSCISYSFYISICDIFAQMKTAPIYADQSKCDGMNFGTAFNVQLWLTGKKNRYSHDIKKLVHKKVKTAKFPGCHNLYTKS